MFIPSFFCIFKESKQTVHFQYSYIWQRTHTHTESDWVCEYFIYYTQLRVCEICDDDDARATEVASWRARARARYRRSTSELRPQIKVVKKWTSRRKTVTSSGACDLSLHGLAFSKCRYYREFEFKNIIHIL